MMILVLGGARSGKSRFAQNLAKALAPRPVYLATAREEDPEFAARVARHRADRGPEWTLIEEPLALSRHALKGRVVVVDCVTLWLSNWFHAAGGEPATALDLATEEVDRTLLVPATWIFVSNELGLGVHATTRIGRQFVDLQGWMNQRLATRADAVVLMVAGLGLLLRGSLPPGAERVGRGLVRLPVVDGLGSGQGSDLEREPERDSEPRA